MQAFAEEFYGYGIQDTGYGIQDTGYRIQDRDAGFRISLTYQYLASGILHRFRSYFFLK